MKKLIVLFLFIGLIQSDYCSAQTESRPLVIGKSDFLHSNILNESRTLNIYLPPNYNAEDSLKYPVIYLLDGGINEDFLHILGLVYYNMQAWIGRLQPSIVVGIEKNNRRRDFTFAVSNIDFIEEKGFQKSAFPEYGGSEKYMDFLEKELQPYIENNYHANGISTLIGESLAGLLGTEILLERPHLFEQYIIISPSLWWGERELLKRGENLLDSNLKIPVEIYIAAPSKEEDLGMYAAAENLYHLLKNNVNAKVYFDYLAEELHSTVMHQAVYNAFEKFHPKTTYSK